MPDPFQNGVQERLEVPPIPKVAARLLRLIDDSDVSIEELADVIGPDPRLVTKVVHLANSPFYRCSRKVESICDAVLVLGINTLKGLTAAVSVQ